MASIDDIRPFQPADTEAVVALWQACGLVVPWNDPRKDIARKLAFQPGLFGVLPAPLGAYEAMATGQGSAPGTVLGTVMAGYEGHRGWVNYLAVAPQARRGGVGRLLMAWAERELRACGCPKINLQVRSSNTQVLAFYAAIGYGQDEVLSLGKRLEHDV